MMLRYIEMCFLLTYRSDSRARYRSDSSVGCGTDDVAIYRNVFFYWPIEVIRVRDIEVILQ